VTSDIAIFGAGCFWGVELAYSKIEGVTATSVGYMGGETKDPTYNDVCTNKTGHAEVVKVEFDSSIVNYKDLVNLFWKVHDPTTLNRQGWDVGTQYRSAIFYHDEEQRQIATESRDKAQETIPEGKKIVTEILPAEEYYLAEEYHQKYLEKKSDSISL
tara:strand:+ start:14275 stop:14748 length:474 start_codon:yes stop_codon:yes gene_type:complete